MLPFIANKTSNIAVIFYTTHKILKNAANLCKIGSIMMIVPKRFDYDSSTCEVSYASLFR